MHPLSFLAPWRPRTSTTLVNLADWLSTTPALGCAFQPMGERSSSRGAPRRCSKVPSRRHRRDRPHIVGPGQELVGQRTPLAAGAHEGEDGVEDLQQGVLSGALAPPLLA